MIPALAEYKTNGEPLYLLPLGYLPLTVSYTGGTPDAFAQAAQSTAPLLDDPPSLLSQAGDDHSGELSGLARALPLAGGTGIRARPLTGRVFRPCCACKSS